MKKSDSKPGKARAWWEKPGLGIMYQIEARPGWRWQRDFDKFNASMKDKDGNLNFNGPFCKMKEWVEFSSKVGLDYHIFEAKWHDGICYFDTKYTDWKTPVDYCRIFADESKKAGLPFMFYYSNIFDHNPEFDDIQPLRTATTSFLAMHKKNGKEVHDISVKYISWMYTEGMRAPPAFPPQDFTYNPQKYEKYVIDQLTELIEKYNPDGMWMDWFMPQFERSAGLVTEFMKTKYPDVVLTFNVSNYANLKWVHYTSGEAHTVESAWKYGNMYRNKKQPWEMVGPIAANWDNPSSRSDPNEPVRIAATVMASGGKYSFGLPAQMDGALYPIPAEQMELVGKWYQPRRSLFVDSTPMKYEGETVPGVEVSEKGFGIIGGMNGNDKLIHIINFCGLQKPLVVRFSNRTWGNIKQVSLEPSGKALAFHKRTWVPLKLVTDTTDVWITKDDVDAADTIIRIKE